MPRGARGAGGRLPSPPRLSLTRRGTALSHRSSHGTEPRLQIPPALRNRVLGKTFLVVILSALLGVALTMSIAADYAKGSALTLAQYTSNFEEYRAGLLNGPRWSAWAWSMVCFLLVGGVVILYEAFGWLFAAGVARAWRDIDRAGPQAETSDHVA